MEYLIPLIFSNSSSFWSSNNLIFCLFSSTFLTASYRLVKGYLYSSFFSKLSTGLNLLSISTFYCFLYMFVLTDTTSSGTLSFKGDSDLLRVNRSDLAGLSDLFLFLEVSVRFSRSSVFTKGLFLASVSSALDLSILIYFCCLTFWSIYSLFLSFFSSVLSFFSFFNFESSFYFRLISSYFEITKGFTSYSLAIDLDRARFILVWIRS